MSDTAAGAFAPTSERSVELTGLQRIQRERHVLGQIAAGVALGEVLEGLLRSIEAQGDGGMKASILFLSDDGRRLLHGAAPSLPAGYNAAVDGIAIGEGVGSCGTVAFRGTPVYAADISTDPLWRDYRDIAIGYGLRACWSTPIRGADAALLGTFAIYYDEPKVPGQADLDAIAVNTQTAALAIERFQSDRRLKHSQDESGRLNQTIRRQAAARILGHRLISPQPDA